MVGVSLLGLLSVVAPVRTWTAQQSDLGALRADVQAREERVSDLQRQAYRWDDPAYVGAQARERLHYLQPGETGYRVVDAPPAPAQTAPAPSPSAAPSPSGLDRLWQVLGGRDDEDGGDGVDPVEGAP